MKTDTKLIIGGIALAGLAYFMFKKQIGKTIEGVGEGISDTIGGVGTATAGAGQSVSEILTGTSAPFAYADTYLDSKSRTQQARQQVLTDIYTYDKPTQSILTSQVQAKEQTKANLDNIQQTKTQSKLDIAYFNTETTKASLDANKAEETERKTEYGATFGQYLKKMFVPTKEVAEERRQEVVSKAKKAVTSIKDLFTKKK